ncbi:hypothetical protein LU276_03870 [Moraxella haemolytica]|uniref:hypothetical protein n=1 Tax=Moraxella haemolytica TaxID=2904119 RepID=UPI0025431F01|nr:hypothetical protein [Moraxella sp. ZY171148]WII95960.1 hypothetical protein LU276_03870 [Moraxella sp. ZY171148]
MFLHSRTWRRFKKELQLESEKVKSNERIALASIEAQKGDRVEQMGLFAKLESKKYVTVWLIVLAVVIVILVAIWREKTDFALEVLKIGGALLAGYFAGFNKGKVTTLEKQRQNDDE